MNILIRLFFISFCIFLYFYSVAQNLVKNPSFEEYVSCPEKISQIRSCKYWKSPSQATPDYFHSCSHKYSSSVPVNVLGKQYARTGDAYTGIILFKKKFPYNEYIQGEFSKTLVEGKLYNVSFFVSCSELSKYSVNNIGVYFSKYDITSNTFILRTEQKRNKLKNVTTNYFFDKNKWLKFSGVYKAKGWEEYLIIGNIRLCNNEKCRLENENGNVEISYCYIDDVCVELDSSSSSSIENEDIEVSKNEIKVGHSLILAETDNIFKENSHIIFREFDDVSKNSKKYNINEELILLKYFAEFIKMYPNILFEISVHTNDQINEYYNLKLSRKRAKAIYNYLKKKGANKFNIIYKGYGSEYEIVPRDNDAGRQNNRIEFKILDIW
jgi:outer membrane protein OmpA-like peptidoglycan-associated protein